MTKTDTQSTKNRVTLQTFILLLVPIILLAGVIALFLSTGGGLDQESPAPIENLDVERYHLEPNSVELYVRNTGPREMTIATVIINDSVMPFKVDPSPTIPRLGHAIININYAWTYGEGWLG